MHFFKRMISASAVLAVSVCCMTMPAVQATDMPTDIHITVETKEIDIEDIPSDRYVTLNIYMENCPPFNSLIMSMEKDSRLQYYPSDRCFSKGEGVRNAWQPDCMYYSDNDNIRKISVFSSDPGETLVEYDSAVAKVGFIIPEDAAPGDFYSLEPLRSYNDSLITVSFSQDRQFEYKDAPFTQLNGGGITITSREQPQQHGGAAGNGEGAGPGDGAGQSGDGQSDGGQSQSGGGTASSGGASSEGQENNDPNGTQTTAVSVSETSSSTTSSASRTTAETVTSSEPETTSLVLSSRSSSTTAKITTGPSEKIDKKKNGGLLVIGVITLVIAAFSSLAMIAEKIRMNKR